MIVERTKKELAKAIYKGSSIDWEVKGNRIIWWTTPNYAKFNNVYNWDTIKQAMEGVDAIIEKAEYEAF